jgi:hypothetical protein
MFVTVAAMNLLIALYVGWRLTRRRAPSAEDSAEFQTLAPASAQTPQSYTLAPPAESTPEAGE